MRLVISDDTPAWSPPSNAPSRAPPTNAAACIMPTSWLCRLASLNALQGRGFGLAMSAPVSSQARRLSDGWYRPVRLFVGHPAPVYTGDDLPDGMIPGARIVADAYRQATGHPINREALAERLRVPLHTAERLLNALAATEPHHGQIPARLNGNTPVDALA